MCRLMGSVTDCFRFHKAPIRSKVKKHAAKKAASGGGALPSTTTSTAPALSFLGNDFRTTKKDKRVIKHASFVSKIQKSSAKPHKRRRPSKKLVANLESLAEALPEPDTRTNDASGQVNIIKHKTLPHKPGALKRKEKMEKLERERFAKNMAQMASVQSTPAAAAPVEANAAQDATSNRWAALRSFISQTMEQQPVFKTKQ